MNPPALSGAAGAEKTLREGGSSARDAAQTCIVKRPSFRADELPRNVRATEVAALCQHESDEVGLRPESGDPLRVMATAATVVPTQGKRARDLAAGSGARVRLALRGLGGRRALSRQGYLPRRAEQHLLPGQWLVAPDATPRSPWREAGVRGDEQRGADVRPSDQRLWLSDGTAAGTRQTSVPADDNPAIEIRGGFAFAARAEVWRTDGASDLLVKPTEPNFYPQLRGGVGARALFGWGNSEPSALWASDGSVAGTSLLRDFAPLILGSLRPAELGGYSYFSVKSSPAQLGATGQLWRTDGTAAHTELLASFSGDSDVRYLTPLGARLVFNGRTGSSGNELWVTDGSAAGTKLLVDLGPGTADGVDAMSPMFATATAVYFLGDNGSTRRGLFATDGTAGGTRFVSDVVPDFQRQTYAPRATAAAFQGKLFYSTTVAGATSLWSSGGTAATTAAVAPLPRRIRRFEELAGALYFVLDGDNDGAGSALYRTDGTANGTVQVGGAPPSVGLYLLRAAGSTLFFDGSDAATGTELWALQAPPPPPPPPVADGGTADAGEEASPRTGRVVAELFEGLVPAGLVGLVQGGADAGARLCECEVDLVVFTGSPASGRKVAHASHGSFTDPFRA